MKCPFYLTAKAMKGAPEAMPAKYLSPKATIEEAAAYLATCIKTEALIKELATNDRVFFSLSSADIQRCIRETNTYDFSLDDVRYIHTLNEHPEASILEQQNDALLEACKGASEDGRLTFKQRILSNFDALHAIQRDLRKNYPGLLYYQAA